MPGKDRKGYDFMRSCIYCGKSLGKDEVCDCPQAVKKRAEKAESAQTASNSGNERKTENGQYSYTQNTAGKDSYNTNANQSGTSYRTGYTEPKKGAAYYKRIIKRKFEDLKYSVKNSGSFFSSLFDFIKRFSFTPVDSVSYNNSVSLPKAVVITVINALILGMSAMLLAIGVRYHSRFTGLWSVFMRSDLNIFTFFRGVLQYALLVFVMLYVLWLIIYFMDKLLMRSAVRFRDFLPRFVTTTIPVTVMGVVGVVLGLFSIYATVMFAVCGVVAWIILTYEALRTYWSPRGANSVFYMMILAFLLFSIVLFNLWRFIF